MIQKQLSQILFISGGTITLIGAVAQLLEFSVAPYIFSTGAALLIFLQVVNAKDNWKAEMRKKRLARNGLISSLFLALAAYSMFTNSNMWVVAVLAYALSSFFLSFRGNDV